jgi:glycerol kinase
MSYILAIDQSTSATKALLFDVTARVVDSEVRNHRQLYPQPGWVEHDAEEIWGNVLEVLGAIAQRNRDKANAAIGLAITNQRETFLVFDRRSGKPLHHAIVWQCRRGTAICDELNAEGHGESVREKSGLKLDSYFSAPKIKWLMKQKPELGRQLESGEALIGTIDAYLIYRLTACKVFATDPTNASRTLLYNIDRLRWDEQLCKLFDVPMRALPEVRESFANFGVTDVAGLLPVRLPICGVMGDSQASLFAQGCHEPGMAKATFGSGTSLLLNAGQQLTTSDFGAVTALAWVYRGCPVYALEGIINYSSATIAWLKDQLGLICDAAETASLAQSVDDNVGVYFVPAFSGLGAPYWNSEARAAIVGMTAHTRKEHVVRAALEAITYQIRDVLEMMGSVAGVVPQSLCADGGPTRNEFLMQFTADIARVELRVADVAESSARGAALAGMLGLKVLNSLPEMAALPRSIRTYIPTMPVDKAQQLYSGWQAAVQRVL